MKPIRKDAPRQRRRERTLARLEAVLKGGVKNVGLKKFMKQVPLEASDRERISKEISSLKSHLGVTTSPLVFDPKRKEYSHNQAA